ncbi:hypothetical protein NOS3756_33720 [Nostoc sp. NIES-3756]|uniref:hypothetical protein n=1 Tax=Nostoc sp. NIES-3756 TaxID=1751286 RepID=UPI0007209519|nr:hypothetical protein [Nostoc sp. NIES-3756]BAT54403.1 hypothetical protein NOS3756_33720 [Nostoc sp. NIES-3756]
MINADFEISGWIAIAQLVIIVIFGYLFSIIAKFRYRNSSASLHIFKPGNYTSCFVDDPRIMFQTVPKWYYFVAVRYQPDGQVANETFYSIVGDVTVINYSDGRWSGTKSNLYSNLLLVALPFIGFVLILLTQSVSASVIAEQSDTSHKLIKYGTILFGSVFLSAPINMIFYFLTHFKRPLQQTNRG